MYAILFTGDIFWTNGYLSEAEAVRTAMEAKDPNARIEWSTEREDLGTAGELAKELDLDLN
jgi:hypothetical protein